MPFTFYRVASKESRDSAWQVMPLTKMDHQSLKSMSHMLRCVKPRLCPTALASERFSKKQFQAIIAMATTGKDRDLIAMAAFQGLSNTNVYDLYGLRINNTLRQEVPIDCCLYVTSCIYISCCLQFHCILIYCHTAILLY